MTYKQQPGQSFEDYARQLNNLGSLCNYPSSCLDRLLRDAFVAGISNAAILSSLIQVCDQLSFRETVERAKLLDTFRQDVDSIRSSRNPRALTAYSTNDSDYCDCANKVSVKKTIPKDYLCYRCDSTGIHFSHDCFAKHRRCHLWNKEGHLAKICQKTKANSLSDSCVHNTSFLG